MVYTTLLIKSGYLKNYNLWVRNTVQMKTTMNFDKEISWKATIRIRFEVFKVVKI